MCIIIDTCTFSSVFDSRSSEHRSFSPVFDWIEKGKGIIIYGGTTYKKELSAAKAYLKIFKEFNRKGKTITLCDNIIDDLENKIRKIEPHTDFDDPHLIAIVIASKCKIICTHDKRAIPFLKKRELYLGSAKKPKLYTSEKNKSLLNDKYLAEICKCTDKKKK